MSCVWLTYAWDDNADGDVDFLAQELIRAGVEVKLDRWNIEAGRRLWEQIEQFIQEPTESDAWLLYATQASLGSEACKEEYAYALDRALNSRGVAFPVIAVFPTDADDELIPAGIRTRLYVSLTDPDWKERIVAAAEGRSASVSRPEVAPYHVQVHPGRGGEGHVIELRPRAGTWAPFIAAIPKDEKESVKPNIMHGPAGRIPSAGMLVMAGEGETPDGTMWFMTAGNQATPTQSYFLFCKEIPSKIVFGVEGGPPQYTLTRPGAE